MKRKEVIDKFISFYKDRGHQTHSQSPLVRKEGNTLFTIAGMLPFKDELEGKKITGKYRVVTCQPCLRLDDLERVAVTGRHHTYFEMLGNFSFNNYWKTEAINWAWELLTDVYKIDSSRLMITTHPQDTTTYSIWLNLVDSSQINMMNTNIWSSGADSMSSYCTEIYFDTKKEGEFDDRYLELYNLVLMNTNGYKSIDTGLGVERLCRVMQEVEDDYLIDIYDTALSYILQRTQPPTTISLQNIRTLLDHSRTILCLIKEGLLPDKKGKGYILTKLIRRCLRTLQLNQLPEEELFHICIQFCDDYTSIPLNLEAIIKQEISKFHSLLTRGLKHINKVISESSTSISKEDMFKLYDTYGVPYDFIEEIALEQGITCEDL